MHVVVSNSFMELYVRKSIRNRRESLTLPRSAYVIPPSVQSSHVPRLRETRSDFSTFNGLKHHLGFLSFHVDSYHNYTALLDQHNAIPSVAQLICYFRCKASSTRKYVVRRADPHNHSAEGGYRFFPRQRPDHIKHTSLSSGPRYDTKHTRTLWWRSFVGR
jgi:hypothetical protein